MACALIAYPARWRVVVAVPERRDLVPGDHGQHGQRADQPEGAGHGRRERPGPGSR
ncbi:hypothetical protein ACH4E7_09575 [Kitasatospora sp. NPDC018058]|uniref:hypothetical protein n=1 Tax=Kitasatospora sp. NPDC018058 TaxID=3364025 RepID=UPI0037BF3B3B